MQTPPPTSAIVLCGGKSTRMGTSKAWLAFDGRPLLLHVIAQLQPLFAEIIVVRTAGQPLPQLPPGIKLTEDKVPDEGPLRGLEAGMHAVDNNNKTVYVTACDMPFINVRVIRRMVDEQGDYDGVAWNTGDEYQPLPLLLRRDAAPQVSRLLSTGKRSLMSLLESISMCPISVEDLTSIDPEGLSLKSLNTPEDYRNASP